MNHQPDDLSEAYAEMQQEGLSVRDEGSLTANTDQLNRRHADEAAGPLTEQPLEGDEGSAELPGDDVGIRDEPREAEERDADGSAGAG